MQQRHLQPTISPAHIVTLARTWLGTPYHHQASAKGIGTDCLGLVRGVYRDLYGHEAEQAPAYSRDWAEAARSETLLDAARRHLDELVITEATTGDVLAFRWRTGMMVKHLGIIVAPGRMLHAFEGSPALEITLTPWWQRHVAAAFRFPRSQ
ncbi:MAG: NlpC/P60 family protein [Hyphomicrobiaceae bacterium]|nr:peptidase P60 [Hyphomicrobiaceae bacterium]